MNRNEQSADIINCALTYVNDFPELKQGGLRVDSKDCSIVPILNPHVPEIGGPTNTIQPPSRWEVHIVSKVFPGPHNHYIAIVESEFDGSLEVSDFFSG